MESFRNAENKFHFALVYPEIDPRPFVWKQAANPFTVKSPAVLDLQAKKNKKKYSLRSPRFRPRIRGRRRGRLASDAGGHARPGIPGLTSGQSRGDCIGRRDRGRVCAQVEVDNCWCIFKGSIMPLGTSTSRPPRPRPDSAPAASSSGRSSELPQDGGREHRLGQQYHNHSVYSN